jgi:uncharacterized protein YecE (DUF72 family)
MQTNKISVGCSELPERVSRESYFRQLSLLESTAFTKTPPSTKTLKGWRKKSPEHAAFTLMAPPSLIDPNSKDAKAAQDFFDASKKLVTEAIVFRSGDLFSPSATNRDFIKSFFKENADRHTIASQPVWIPGGLWDLKTAMKLVENLDVVVAFDPLANDALGENVDTHAELLAGKPAYLRIGQLGHTRSRFEPQQLEELAERVQFVEKAWVVFHHKGKFTISQR